MLQADSACSLGVRYALAQEIPLPAGHDEFVTLVVHGGGDDDRAGVSRG
jgi:hypothetical protein